MAGTNVMKSRFEIITGYETASYRFLLAARLFPHLELQAYKHTHTHVYGGASKSFRTESITKYTLTTINTR